MCVLPPATTVLDDLAGIIVLESSILETTAKKYEVASSEEADKEQQDMICEACNQREAIGVACVPGVPCSAAYCLECLEANSHPMWALIANTVCCGGIQHTNESWKEMVEDSLKAQEKTMEWFQEQVEELLEKEREELNKC